MPYFNPDLRILDASGLMDKGIARLPGRHMYKLTADYFLKRSPDYYLMMVHAGQTDGAVTGSPEFQRRYEIMKRFSSLDLTLAQPATTGERPVGEDVNFVLYRRKS